MLYSVLSPVKFQCVIPTMVYIDVYVLARSEFLQEVVNQTGPTIAGSEAGILKATLCPEAMTILVCTLKR